jgi:hypothetical protein
MTAQAAKRLAKIDLAYWRKFYHPPDTGVHLCGVSYERREDGEFKTVESFPSDTPRPLFPKGCRRRGRRNAAMADATLPTLITPADRRLTAAEYQRLADVPPEVEWFNNIKNKSTKRAYENAVRDFIGFTGITRPEEFRTVTRAHVIAWRDDLERRLIGSASNPKSPEGSTIRHRLAALSSLFEYLCDKNAVSHNPVKGVKRPKADSGEGKTPALGDHQARQLLAAPCETTIKEKRDRAILSTLLPLPLQVQPAGNAVALAVIHASIAVTKQTHKSFSPFWVGSGKHDVGSPRMH